MYSRKSSLFLSIVAMIALFLAGCASGPGTNKHQFFAENHGKVIPTKAFLNEASAKLETVAQFSDGTEIQMFFVGGIVGALLAKEPKVIRSVRGSFAVGQVFAETLSALSTGDGDNALGFNIKAFNHYAVPGMTPRLKALMYFETTDEKSETTVLSAYACDWKSRGLAITPGAEKDMLREMVDHSLHHWADLYVKDLARSGFPPPRRGTFEGSGVTCAFDVFVQK